MITREEAKHNSAYFLYEFEKERRVKCDNFIDQLFDQQDELQQHIKSLESQLSSNTLQLTCEQCKYLKPETCDDYEQCKFDDVCIRWEANLKTDHFQLKNTK